MAHDDALRPDPLVLPDGRTNHQNGFATIAEAATGFPGNNTHVPMENAYWRMS